MSHRRLWIAFAALVIVGVVATAIAQHFRRPDFRKDVARSEQLDTAHVQRKDSSARVDSAVHTLRRIGSAAVGEADRIHAIADTAGQHAASVRDSLEMWRKRDSLHVVEIDSLRSRIRSDSLQKILLTVDRNAWRVHSDSVVRAMDQLRGDLKKAQADHCRILPFVPCPSRKTSLLLGATAGAVIAANPKETVTAVRKIFTLGR